MSSLSWLPAESTDVPQDIIDYDRGGKRAQPPPCWGVGVGVGVWHPWRVLSLTRTNINARQIAAHNLIHCLLLPSSHPSPSHLSLASLSHSFFLSFVPLFCQFFSLRVVNENNGQSFKYLWILLGSISKDCHLHGNSLLAAFPTPIHLFSICFSLLFSFTGYIAIIPITI